MNGQPGPESSNTTRPRIFVVGLLACLLAGTVLFSSRKHPDGPIRSAITAPTPPDSGSNRASSVPRRATTQRVASDPTVAPEKIVADKVTKFARSRRKLAHDLADHFKTPVPPEFDRFFDAAEAGRYDEMKAIYKTLREQRESGADKSWYSPSWRAVTETLGVADVAHDWPAQKLLDYGNSVLAALRPGMVYAGGTDPGCYIPTLLNETTDGERHPVLTQNALADNTYVQYLSFVYGDRLKTITDEQSQHAFQDYLADAQKRLQHDQQFPDEPKQIRPGEDIRIDNQRVQVSGQVAVMTINEKLFQSLMQNNPGVSFAMEQSFPFQSMYANATTLGPVMELGVQDKQNALTADRANQSLDYWRTAAQDLLSDPDSPEGSDPRKAYSKLALSQAGLFQAHQYSAQAEQAFQIANEIWPANPEAVSGYANMLVEQQRVNDAVRVVENALRADPNNKQFSDLLIMLSKVKAK